MPGKREPNRKKEKREEEHRNTYTTSHQTIHGFKGKRHEWIYYSILTSNKTENEGKEMNEYTIPPHAKQYIESKGKEVNRYTFVGR